MFRKNKLTRWLGVLPGAAASLLPAGICPVCWTAYTGLLSSIGCSFLLKTVYLLPLIVVCLLLSLVSLAYKAKCNKGYMPLVMGILASVVILVGKFMFASDIAMYSGIGILIIASIWNSWPTSSCKV